MATIPEKCEDLTHGLHLTTRQFLCGIPVRTIHWEPDILQELYSGDGSLPAQRCVLENTVHHPLVKKFPLKLSYQLAFLKNLISKLENSGQEVLEELYVTYCDLLESSGSESECTYRHFLLDASTITLRESSCLISHGTTGLHSWQAGLALADWCLLHASCLRGRRVLELGSGAGLTGLVVSLCCEPHSFWFSDCHPAVLDLLQHNILLHTQPRASEPHPRVLLTTQYNNTEIGLLALPWEDIPSSDVTSHLSPDIILAADVVFDVANLPALCGALRHLLWDRHCTALLACTLRSRDTLQAFLQQLGTESLEAAAEELPPPTHFQYTAELPVTLYKVTARPPQHSLQHL